MSAPFNHTRGPFEISAEAYAKLSTEDQRRIGSAMRFLADVKALYLSGMQVAADMLDRKTPAVDVALKLMDYERDLRIAANDMSKHPLKVLHAEALRKGETKLDDSAWLMRCRIKASEARKAREEIAREDQFNALTAPVQQETAIDEPEPEAGPQP